MIDFSELQANIVIDLQEELGATSKVNEPVLQNKVKLAIIEVMNKREYGNSKYTEEQILDELSTRFYSTIENLARYDYNQTGTEGQSSHSENSVSRIWLDRNKWLNDVHAFVKVI